MATVISHFYNEEFLLPMWLKHHKDRFDNGILIDFNSTDMSVEIIKSITPSWQIVKANQIDFNAIELDKQVSQIEASVTGPKIALTITEFFLGNPNELQGMKLIPSIELINMEFDKAFDDSIPWHTQRNWGYHYRDKFTRREFRGRIIHDGIVDYPVGRHFKAIIGGPFLIYRVANCLVNQKMIDRKLQIQSKIPLADKEKGFGVQHHNFGMGLTEEVVLSQQQEDRKFATDLGSVINGALIRETAAIKYKSSNDPLKYDLLKELDLRLEEVDRLYELNSHIIENLQGIQFENKKLKNELENSQRHLLNLEESISWKITRPLRFVRKYFKKII